MALKHGSIDFENTPQVSKMKDEDAALAAIAKRHPSFTNVVLSGGVGGTVGSSQRSAHFTYDDAGEG